MKTLKKTLCLVLAVVMVVGVLILPASAANTTTAATDDLEVKYKEAFEVLKAEKIYQGGADGNLWANEPITRREAAAIVARMLATEDVVKNYPDTSLDFADCADLQWGRNYIAYCQDKEIIAGTDTGFWPDSNVTGYEFAKMLLVAIGFDPDDNGFYGAPWAGNVYSTVIKTKLNKGLGTIDWSTAIKRGEVAQLALNALIYTKDGGKEYTVYIPATGDEGPTAANTIYQGSDYNEAMLYAQSTGAKVKSVDSFRGSLADVMYNGLKKVTGEVDAFMRPLILWKDNDGEVVKYTMTPDAKFDGNFTKADMDKLDGYDVYYNGGKDSSLKLYTDKVASVNGYEVEVYNKAEGVTPRIIVREAYVAQVGKADAAAKTVPLTVYGDNGTEVVSNDFTVGDKHAAYAALTAAGENTFVAAYVKPGWDAEGATAASVLEVVPLEKVTTTITRIDDNNLKTLSFVTTTDKTYMVNNEALLKIGADKDAAMDRNLMTGTPTTRKLTVGAATLYTLNGNILFVDMSTSTTGTTIDPKMQFAYCFDIKLVDNTTAGSSNWASEGGKVDNKSVYGYMVRLLLTDGTTVEKVIQETASATVTEEQFKEVRNKYIGKLVSYAVDSKTDVYTITPLAAAANPKTVEITQNKAEGKFDGEKVLFDSKTIFLVVTTKDTETDSPNWKVTADFYSIYNVPTLKEGVGAKAIYAGVFDGTNHKVISKGEVANVVVVIDPGKESGGTTVPTGDNNYFVVGNANATKVRILLDNDKFVEFIQYNAVVNGELTKVNVKVTDSENAPVLEPLNNEVMFFKNPTIETIGGVDMVADWGTPLEDDPTTLKVNGVSDIVNDKIKINTKGADVDSQADYLASVQVKTLAFEYDLTNGTIVALKLADIKKNDATTGYAVTDTDHTTLSFLYLTGVTK